MEQNSLETQDCSRCGGSGRYSYCTMYGDRCFKCGGAGKVYTKRGLVAKHYLDGLREVKVEDLKVGDLFQEYSGINTKAFFRVEEVKLLPAKEAGYVSAEDGKVVVQVIGSNTKVGKINSIKFLGNKVRKGFSAEEKAEQFRKALAYQATLGKNGKPLKRVKEAA